MAVMIVHVQTVDFSVFLFSLSPILPLISLPEIMLKYKFILVFKVTLFMWTRMHGILQSDASTLASYPSYMFLLGGE